MHIATPSAVLTPISIENNRFVKWIFLEQTPLLTCCGFVTSQKWLISRRINSRKRLFLIDVGVKVGAFLLQLARMQKDGFICPQVSSRVARSLARALSFSRARKLSLTHSLARALSRPATHTPAPPHQEKALRGRRFLMSEAPPYVAEDRVGDSH